MTKQLKPCPFCGGKCDVVTGLGMIDQSLAFSKQDEWVSVKDINEKLKNLKFIRFAEIKNQVGTRFMQQFYDDKYIIAHNQTTNENIIININKSLAFGVNAISDDTLVEVINETTSNNVGDR
ncbi:hypothetical protein J3U16_06415 [Gilliamella sp. B3023]|uniref:hypothetical protein n=1 Tax=Gilliamella sp. B3023 TaxID=2817987 RepID=UPI00226A8793|nr:hypothetical protein [Gilliamella sp. B3023]MCX8674922.1 hypothetical protein [Gilliamella sp. B3023]